MPVFRIADRRGLRAPLPAKAGAGRRAADLFSHSSRAGAAGRRKRPLARAGLQPADPGAGKRHGAHAAEADRRAGCMSPATTVRRCWSCFAAGQKASLRACSTAPPSIWRRRYLPNRADARILCQTLGKQLAPRVFEAARRGDLSHVFFSFGVPKRVTSCSKD